MDPCLKTSHTHGAVQRINGPIHADTKTVQGVNISPAKHGRLFDFLRVIDDKKSFSCQAKVQAPYSAPIPSRSFYTNFFLSIPQLCDSCHSGKGVSVLWVCVFVHEKSF